MRVAFRMEGGRSIGMGHVMRCLTLAKVLRARGHQVVFLCGRDTAKAVKAAWPQAVCRLIAQGLVEKQDALRCRVAMGDVDWVVVDHYRLGAVWERTMGGRVLAMDDLARVHEADVVVDTALYGKARYRGKISARAKGLFGPAYALLRPGVIMARGMRRDEGRVFVCFGGADAQDMTRRVARVLAGKCQEVDFVVGYAYGGKDALLALCQRQKGWKLHVQHGAPEMLMAQAAIAIGAGGTMTWERCAVGVPSVVMSIADNQVEMSKALGARGVIRYLGDAAAVSDADLLAAVQGLRGDTAAREAMEKTGRAMLDGMGAKRVADVMRRIV